MIVHYEDKRGTEQTVECDAIEELSNGVRLINNPSSASNGYIPNERLLYALPDDAE